MESIGISITKDPQFVEYLLKLKVIDDKTVRDIKIRSEYEQMKELKTQKLKRVREMLADKYFVCEKSIEGILYNKGENENKILLVNFSQSLMASITLIK